MALTLSGAFTASSTSATATLQSDLASGTAAIGDFLVVFVAADNDGTSGVSSISTTMTDSVGNTYTHRATITRSPGSASGDGASLAIFTCPVTIALTTSDRITANFSPNTDQKIIQAIKIVPDAGETVEYRGVGAGTTGASTTPSQTTSSITSGDTVIGAFAMETDDVGITYDSDTTNGSWSSSFGNTADGGPDTSAMQLRGQYKTVSGTGAQTLNFSGLGASRDWAGNWITVYPQAIPNVGSASGTGSATATGAAQFNAVASAAGTNTVSGSGNANAPAVGAASGTGVASATGVAAVGGVGSAAGTAAASVTPPVVAS